MNNKINNLPNSPEVKRQTSDTKNEEPTKLQLFIEAIKPIASSPNTQVLVLQHPQEKREELATVAILAKCLPKTVIKVGLSWPNIKKIVGREVDANRWAVIYLGTQAESNKALKNETPVVMTGKTKKLSELEGIIVLDGSWREAKTLWWRNAWLLKLNRIVLNPKGPAIYNALRKEPRRESISSIEAVAMVLAEIEKNPEIYEQLTAPLKELIATVGVKRTKPNSGPRRDWRRKKRSR